MPARHLALALPIVMLVGFAVGLVADTGVLKQYILPVTVLMIYPNMIGFKPSEMLGLSHVRLVISSLALNFTMVPLVAYILGTTFLLGDPELFAGLAIASLLPTSNMTIAFTTLGKGNVPAAVKLSVACLVAGSLLAPWYLLLMVGKYVPVDVPTTLRTITVVVFLPMILGTTTYSLLQRRYTSQEIRERFMPCFPGIGASGMLFIIFVSVSTSAQRIVANPEPLAVAFLVQLAFYGFTYSLPLAVGHRFFDARDSTALVFSIALRGLAISMGLAAAAFGPNAALMVTLAIPIQSQTAAWLARFTSRQSRQAAARWTP